MHPVVHRCRPRPGINSKWPHHPSIHLFVILILGVAYIILPADIVAGVVIKNSPVLAHIILRDANECGTVTLTKR
jgi:hypothetical protein